MRKAWNKSTAKYPFGPDNKRPCIKCGVRKTLEEFKKNAACAYGRDAICHVCHNAVAKLSRSRPEWETKRKAWKLKRKADPNSYRQERNRTLRRHFKMTIEEYESMKSQQGGVCMICGRPPKKKDLSVDHDHATGDRRALLCGNCNRGLGSFHDDPRLLIEAARYITRFSMRARLGA